MKIVKKDNFNRDLFSEIVFAENVNRVIGEEMVKLWNEKYWNGNSEYYLKLVDDDYELYDGYADLL
ncbi:hypothetical protein NV379_01970 [Paenibacillus sp. N1-5-1-14]|uniref:hypothetical protein n=1 Tax=Paenibacillus radicibacter TaxID=2972488 RepID=UPI0021595C86|nr:hypothetical protein [Paenibacillus radicibacter]MCR8641412.1 hypothetical protein [Paenibacillus radicibacter]